MPKLLRGTPYFPVGDVDASTGFGRGADVVYGPLMQDAYRMLEFPVRDRDGHVLGFGQSVEM